MTGGGGREGGEGPVAEQQPQQQYNQSGQQQERKPCEFELAEFLNCAQKFDLSACENLNQILKECRVRYGV